MQLGGSGGRNTITGLTFERKADLRVLIAQIPGYTVFGNEIFFNGDKVASLYPKNDLYKKLLQPNGINSSSILSKQLLPDQALLSISKNTLFIIEMKFQEVAGSVDEKLQTCDFKRRQYQKLLTPLNINVEYVYLLSDWFKQPGYRDTLDYIHLVNCHYFFNEIPLDFLGLPPITQEADEI